MTLRWAAQLSGGALQWGAHFESGAAPAAPTNVDGAPTGGTTSLLTLTDNSGGAASHRWQIRPVAGVWADAVGATNPSPPGTVSFAATGLAPATLYEAQARAEDAGGNSAYAAGLATWWTDNTGGGDSEIPPEAPTDQFTGPRFGVAVAPRVGRITWLMSVPSRPIESP